MLLKEREEVDTVPAVMEEEVLASNREVRIAAVQLAAGPDPHVNVEHAIALVERAAKQGATYVQLPEYFNYRGKTSRYVEIAETIPGPTTARLADLAKELGIVLHVGSTFERSPDPTRTYNTSVVIGPHGGILATYQKGHLFDVHVPGEVDYEESRAIVPGDQLVVVDLADFRLGLSVCFDLRFSETYRQLALHGATVFAIPSSFAVPTGRVHWEVLLRARAIESHAYVVAAAQVGTTDEGVSSYGHSMIVGPWGEVLAESTSDGEDVIYATISEEEVARRRAQIDVWHLQRPDLYDSLDHGE
ncbi:MAG: carbon-nitrogen hydrolase family protein [Acidimicrobiales bacterium]